VSRARDTCAHTCVIRCVEKAATICCIGLFVLQICSTIDCSNCHEKDSNSRELLSFTCSFSSLSHSHTHTRTYNVSLSFSLWLSFSLVLSFSSSLFSLSLSLSLTHMHTHTRPTHTHTRTDRQIHAHVYEHIHMLTWACISATQHSAYIDTICARDQSTFCVDCVQNTCFTVHV